MPPSHAPRYAPDSFSKMLELLAPLDDASIVRWAADFDWTMPVPVSHVVDGTLVETYLSALDQILASGNDRLLDLLMRPGLFDREHRVSTSMSSNSIRRHTTAWREPFTEDGLWRSAWFQALSMGRLDLVHKVAQVAGTKMSVRVPGPDLSNLIQALHRAPYRSRQSLVAHVLLDAGNALFHRLLPDDKPPSWANARHGDVGFELAKMTSELGMFNLIVETLPGRPPAKLFTHLLASQAPPHKEVGQALSLLELADQRGGFRGQDSNGQVAVRDLNGLPTQWVSPTQLLIDRLARTKMPEASFRKMAMRLLDWPQASTLAPDPRALTQALARRCLQWNGDLLDHVRKVNPKPTPREMAWLMLGASQEHYEPRLEDFLTAEPSMEAWQQLAKWLDGSANQHAQAAGVGGKSSKNDHHTNGFPRLWQRAAALVSSLPAAVRPGVDEAFRATIASNHADNAALAARMLSIYQTHRLDLSTPKVGPSPARTPRL